MLKLVFPALAAVLALASAAASAAAALNPVSLQCEYQTAPVGVGVATPQFSWKFDDPAHTRGQAQTARQILVATDPAKLAPNKADIWDSGVARTDANTAVFAGKKLLSSKEYFWSVRVFDKDGEASAWSTAERFVTGALEPAEWEAAAWLKHPTAPVTKHIWFRKTLRLASAPKAVFAHVAALGHYELYINGKKVDNRVLAPALTNFEKRLLYVSHDISKLLAPGENVVAVWFAAGWASYHCIKKTPSLKVRLEGTSADGKPILLTTDTSWRCAVSNSADNLAVFGFGNNGSETVDGRDANPAWNTLSFDDSKWENAAETTQKIELSPHTIPPSQITEILPTKKITGPDKNGVYKIDLGKNFTGWTNVKMRGLKSGDKITIMSADDSKTLCDFNQRNFYIAAGKDEETFCNRFNYAAGRYINIAGLRQKPELSDVTGLAVNTALRHTARFKSSNDLFNKIYETDLWTFIANTTEGYTSDCPHRERCGYGEVATACSWGLGLPNYDAGAYYEKVVRDWADVQTEDGWGRHTAPQPNSDHWGGPMWSSAGMNVAWHHFQHYGDKRIIELAYPTAKRWLEFLRNNTKDGLLKQYRRPPHFLGDWLAPYSRKESGKTPQAVFFNNCVYVMNLETFVRFANLLGKADDAALYGKRLAELRPAIHAKFYDATKGSYCTGTQVQNAFALLTGIVPESERARVAASIHNDLNGKHPYFDMGSSGLYVLLRYFVATSEEGATVAKILNKTSFPGYGHFIAQGESTWPEDWKINVPSRIHTCYTGISGWLIKGLCGIQIDPEQPGYKHFFVRPQFSEEVSFAEAEIDSPQGKIATHWERKDGRIKLSLLVPPNTRATVVLPWKTETVTAGKYEWEKP
jgi:alpha-L-rhamnosidase